MRATPLFPSTTGNRLGFDWTQPNCTPYRPDIAMPQFCIVRIEVCPQHTTTEAASIAGAAAASVADFGHELAAVDDMLAIAEAAASKTDARSSKAVIGRAMGLVQLPLNHG